MRGIKFILAVLVGALMLGQIAHAAPQVVKVSFNAKDSNPQVKAFREIFVPHVEKATDGRFKFELYPGGVLGQARQRIQSMRNGMIQMSVETTANLSQFAPMLSLLDMPYLVPSRESVQNLLKTETGKELFDPVEKNLAVRPLAAFMSTFRIIGLNRPGKTLDEISGSKIRTPNSREYITAINSLGLTATPMAHSESFTGIQQKVINGIDIEVPSFQEDHFYEVANNIIKADHLPVVFVLCVSNNFFNKLPQADKDIFIQGAQLFVDAVSREYDAFEEKALAEMDALPGVTVTKLTEEEKSVWREKSASAYDSLTPEQTKMVEKIREAFK